MNLISKIPENGAGISLNLIKVLRTDVVSNQVRKKRNRKGFLT